MSFLSDFDAKALVAEYENHDSRQVKRELIKAGYPYQASFYGAIRDEEADDHTYARIEVLADKPQTGESFFLLREFIADLKPKVPYSIFKMRVASGEIQLVALYGGHFG